MPNIIKLPKEIAELIAAGEVIERPSSVIKELCENSIDAKATVITVEIKNGGITYMRVTDNGCGIKKEDIKTAFLRHATSKITSKEDLNKIASLGFRGEALASVSAVSRVEVLSAYNNETGVKYVINGGEEKEFFETGCPKGTTIIVRDLFYNTPARMKFLKRDATEGSAVGAIIERLALSHPEISFKFIKDGKIALQTPGDNNGISAIYSVLGKDYAASLINLNETNEGINVKGYICKPVYCRANRNGQYFFINNRFVKSGTVCAALEQAYKNSVMVGKFPAAVLYLSIPYETLDVNVHPTKTEVRFSDEKRVFYAVYRAVKNALNQNGTHPELKLSKSGVPFEKDVADQTKINFNDLTDRNKDISETDLDNNKDININENKYTIDDNLENKNNNDDRTVAKAFKKIIKDDFTATEILRNKEKSGNILSNTEEETETVIKKIKPSESKNQNETENINVENINTEKFVLGNYNLNKVANFKDNADESVNSSNLKEQKENNGTEETFKKETEEDKENNLNYSLRIIGEAFKTYIIAEYNDSVYFIDKHAAHERILFNSLNINIEQQLLLSPIAVKLDSIEYNAVLENIDSLTRFGFSIEDFGNGNIKVLGVPAIVAGDEVSVIHEIAGKLKNNVGSLTKREEDIKHSVSCKAAIKAGDITTPEEMLFIAKKVLLNNDVLYCPHGRSVAFELKKRDFEKQFGRQ